MPPKWLKSVLGNIPRNGRSSKKPSLVPAGEPSVPPEQPESDRDETLSNQPSVDHTRDIRQGRSEDDSRDETGSINDEQKQPHELRTSAYTSVYEPEAARETIESVVNSQADPAAPETTLISTPLVASEERVTWLWNAAYDRLLEQKPELLNEFEIAIYSRLTITGRPRLTSRRSSTRRLDWIRAVGIRHQERWKIMNSYLDQFLSQSASILGGPHEDDSIYADNVIRKNTDGDADEPEKATQLEECEAHSLRDLLRSAVERSRDAVLAWAIACLSLESLLDPGFPFRSARKEAVTIISKMEWYIRFWKLLPSDDYHKLDEPWRTPDLDSPVGRLVRLYEAILSYQIMTVCHHRQTFEGTSLPFIGISDFEKCQSDINIREERFSRFSGEGFEAEFSRIFRDSESNEALSSHGPKPEMGEDSEGLTEVLKSLNVDEQQVLDLNTEEGLIFGPLYKWARTTQEFRRFIDWESDANERLLWLDGGPGFGKAALVHAAIQGLRDETEFSAASESKEIAYFFYDQNTPRHGNFVFAMKSLIYQLLKGQPTLAKHVKSNFSTTNRKGFDDENDFFAITTVLYAMLRDGDFRPTYFVIDSIEELAVDEEISLTSLPNSLFPRYGQNLDDLLTLISTTVKVTDNIRWLVSFDSTRFSPEPEFVRANMQLCLAIKPHLDVVRDVAHAYATFKIEKVASEGFYEEETRHSLIKNSHKAPSNLLWLDMALDRVKRSPAPWNAPDIMIEIQSDFPDVETLYAAQISEMRDLREHDRDYCRSALLATAVAYRPLLDTELRAILDLPPEVNLRILLENMLPAFLKFHEDKISNCRRVRFAHVSARHFVRRWLGPQELAKQHAVMTRRCLNILAEFSDSNADSSLGNVSDNAPVNYAATFWTRHLSELNDYDKESISWAKSVLENHALHWLEILDSRNILPDVLWTMAKLGSRLTALKSNLGISISDFRKTIVGTRQFFNAHHQWKTLSAAGDPRGPHEEDKNRVSPQNSLLFCSSDLPYRSRLLERYFPWLITAPSIRIKQSNSVHILDHSDWVRGCVFTPDARLVASASDDKNVRLWDVKSGKLQQVLEGASGYALSVVVSRSGPNNRPLLASHESFVIRVWDLCTGEERAITEIVNPSEVENEAKVVKGQDGTGSTDENEGPKMESREDRIDTREGEGLEENERSSDDGSDSRDVVTESYDGLDVESISISGAGNKLAAATSTGLVVWDIPSFDHSVWKDEEPSDDQMSFVVFSYDGSLLASSTGSEIALWDTQTAKIKRRFPDRTLLPTSDESVPEMAPSGDESVAERTSEEAASNETQSDHTEPEKEAGHSADVNGLAFSNDGLYLASGSHDRSARIWDVETGTTLAVLLYHQRGIQSVAFSPNGIYLATASLDSTIGIWKRQDSGKWGCGVTLSHPEGVLRGPLESVFSVTFCPQSRFLASSGTDSRLRIWDIEAEMSGAVMSEAAKQHLDNSGSSSTSLPSADGHTSEVTSVAISKSCDVIASGCYNGTIGLWSGQTGLHSCEMKEAHFGRVTALVFSRDGTRLVSSSTDRTARVWNIGAESISPRNQLKKHDDWVRSVALSPDMQFVATASDDQTVMVWDTSTASGLVEDKPWGIFKGHTDWVYDVVFSHDGKRLASIGDDGHVMIWELTQPGDKNTPDQVLRCPFALHQNGFKLAFSAEGNMLMMVNRNATVAIWRLGLLEKASPYVVKVENGNDYDLMQIAESHPDVLLNKLGASTLEDDEPGETTSKTLHFQSVDLSPSWASITLNEDSSGIMWGNREVIYLPAEYRPTRLPSCQIQGHSVAIGCKTGQVLLFRFSENYDLGAEHESPDSKISIHGDDAATA